MVSKYSGCGCSPREARMWVLEEQVPAEPGDSRAPGCGNHRQWKSLQKRRGFEGCHNQICILKDGFSCYGDWGKRNWLPSYLANAEGSSDTGGACREGIS